MTSTASSIRSTGSTGRRGWVSSPRRRAGPSRINSPPNARRRRWRPSTSRRSEEHTSELQSLMRISYAVFCLKKKKKKQKKNTQKEQPVTEHIINMYTKQQQPY